MQDNKNFLLAIVLSMMILLVWQVFYGMPQAERQRQAQIAAQRQAQQAAQPGVPGAPAAPGAPAIPGAPAAPAAPTLPGLAAPGSEPREATLAKSPRVAIDTPAIRGSISLKGGRIDDVVLKKLRETVDPKSANIVLLSPAGTPAPYYADFGWFSTDAALGLPNADSLWTSSDTALSPGKPVTLTFENGRGLFFAREFSVDANAMFTVVDRVENKGGGPISLSPYSVIERVGTPKTEGFLVLHEGLVGFLADRLQEETYSSIDKDKEKVLKSTGGFVGITDKYWATAIAPVQNVEFTGSFSSVQNGPIKNYRAIALMPAAQVAAGATAETRTHFFAGAKEVAIVDGYEKALGIKRFDLMIDWGWYPYFTKPLFYLIDWLYKWSGNFGIAILLVTIIVKFIFFPLANKSYASMARMKAVQPAMLAIRDRYKDDKLKQQQALMELYKKEKINPLAGCWPILIQIPVFFALYKVLYVTIEMRQAPFFGWIRDLAAPDPTSIFNLFGLLPYQVPDFLLVGIWPLIMGVTMFVQMKMNPEPTDPVQKTMFAWMPVIFTFMLGTFAAGLVIYWAWNNLLSILQQGVIMKKHGVKIELWDNLRGLFVKKPASEGGKV